MSEKVYTRVKEAEEMIKKLCEKQPDALWTVRPEMVAVLGVDNKKRPEKSDVLAKIKAVKGEEKTILKDNNIPVRYIISLFWSDWREWKEKKKQWVIFHELLHIHSEIGKTVKHDSEDFKLILDKVGVSWSSDENVDKLPDLINDDVKFNLDLRPNLVTDDGPKEKDEDE